MILIALAMLMVCIAAGLLLAQRQGGFQIDWWALWQRQPPYVVNASIRIIHIDFSDRDAMMSALAESKARIDVWSISDTTLYGTATDANIRRLRKAGLQVVVDYSSYEEYQKANEAPQSP